MAELLIVKTDAGMRPPLASTRCPFLQLFERWEAQSLRERCMFQFSYGSCIWEGYGATQFNRRRTGAGSGSKGATAGEGRGIVIPRYP